MVKKAVAPDIAQFIAPLNMNGLQGRMLVAPPTGNRKRELLLVGGHHTRLERWWSLIQSLQNYGKVTMPDLPGFGGMQGFSTIGKRPTIDNYADYLAAFIRLRYKRKRLTIIGISFGFVVASRMLQRYPELAKQVDLVVSVDGFIHHDDFMIPPAKRRTLVIASRLLSLWPMAQIVQFVLRLVPAVWSPYCTLPIRSRSLLNLDPFSVHVTPDVEESLWRLTDLSSHLRLLAACLQLDNCRQKVALPVWHLHLKPHGLVDEMIAKQHLLIVYATCRVAAISVVSRDGETTITLPASLRKALQ